MPANWDATTELRLLICCINPDSKPNWEKVSEDMGSSFTAEACRQRFAKIKKTALETSTAVASTTSPSPAKRNRGRKDQADGTPTKKSKKDSKPKTPVKTGDAEDAEDAEVKNEGVKIKDEEGSISDAEGKAIKMEDPSY